jgi:F-type H+-transporting ATPase subunit gamma
MPSLREIRRKIKSVKSIQQITKAMKMVAAARLRRAQARILSARPFAQKMEELMTHLLSKVEEEGAHPLFVKRSGEKRALLLVTADKGLCGAFNTNLIREATKYMLKHGAQNVALFVVGRKGRDFFRRIQSPIDKEYLNIFNNLNFAHAELITADLLEGYTKKSWVTVDILYNEFKSVIQQKLVVKTLLPIAPVEHVATKPFPDFIYEPVREQLLEALIQRFLKSQVFRVLLESSAAELGARMAAMDSATRNGRELLDSLTLAMNRTRQTSITKEILEVVSGAEALK